MTKLNNIHFFCIFLFVPILIIGAYSEKKSDILSNTVVNTHKDGGFLEKWLILGPFNCSVQSKHSIRKDYNPSVDKDINAEDHDFLVSLGGEKSAFVQKYTAVPFNDFTGKRIFISAEEFSADSNGYVVLDPVLKSGFEQVTYAFCMVESFIPCSVRCFFGSEGDAGVMLKGQKIKSIWKSRESGTLLSSYFDTFLEQGMNPILLKFINKKGNNRFTFAIYDIVDSLLPFRNAVDSLEIELNKEIIEGKGDSLCVVPKFNIIVPEHVFKTSITLSKDKGFLDKPKQLINRSGSIGSPFLFGIMEDLRGAVRIDVLADVEDDRKLSTFRYIWKGNFNACLDSQQIRFEKLGKNLKQEKDDNTFVNLLSHGLYQWAKEWFETIDYLSSDEKARQLEYVESCGDVIEAVFRGEELRGGISYPLYIRSEFIVTDEMREIRDPSYWLNYKYPDIYKLPQERKQEGYGLWLYLPASIKNTRKKIPLILSLHGVGSRGYNINKIKEFGVLPQAENSSEFPFAIVTPQCHDKYLWDTYILRGILDKLVATGRFDKKRIYIMGTGMGGFEAWHLASIYPDIFAAIVPINGGGDVDKANTFKKVAVWAFHGAENSIVPIEKTQYMITAIKELGILDVKFSIYSESGQKITSSIFSDKRLYDWLLQQRK